MRKSTFDQVAHSLLEAVIRGKDGAAMGNPAVTFTKAAKRGDMDAVSDEDYALLLEEVEEIARWWNDKPFASGLDLLQAFLETTAPTGEAIDGIAELLAGEYEKTGGFLPELSDPDALFTPGPEGTEPPERDLGRSPFPDMRTACAPQNPYADDPSLASPKAIYDYITQHIHGQRDACRAAANLLYNHVHGHRRTLLMVGPTGCGKTEIWRVCRTLYPYIIVVDSNQLTAEGWAGSFKVKDIFNGLDEKDIEKSIVIFDEFDKLCEPKIGSGGTNHSHVEQDALLKLIDGEQMGLKTSSKEALDFNSSYISFVFLGSFESLTEVKNRHTAAPSLGFGHDLRKQEAYDEYDRTITLDDVAKFSGMRREIAGRIGSVVQLQAMTEQDFCEIMLDEVISPIRKLEREYHIRINVDDELFHALARETAANHMGIRYLNCRIQDLLDNAMFQHPELDEYCLRAKPSTAAPNDQERSDV